MKKKDLAKLVIEAGTFTGWIALAFGSYMAMHYLWDKSMDVVWTGMISGANKLSKKLTGEETRLPL